MSDAPTVASSEPVLRVEDLVKHFDAKRSSWPGASRPRVHAVDGVSFDLFPGETLGIVGESGCGKSTLARTLVRLTEPTSGSAWYGGRDIFQLSRDELRAVRRDIQMVFQDPYSSVNPRLTIERVVAEAWDGHPDIAPRGDRRARIVELLERVGLDADALGRFPREFSGGQLQRIGIARALGVGPRLMICDEPVSALDVSIQAQVINLLKGLQRDEHVAYIFISHDLAVIQQMADRIAVMYLGKIVETGPTDAICENPTHPYTQALLTAVPMAERAGTAAPPTRIRLRGEPPDPSNPPSGCRFRTRCFKAQPVCAEQEPPLVVRDQPGVRSACHFAEAISRLPEGELAAARSGSPADEPARTAGT